MIVRTVLAFAIGWSAIYAVKYYAFDRLQAEIGQPYGLQLTPPVAELPKFDVNPQAWQTIPVPQIDTQAYGRIAIESMARDMQRRNDEAMQRMREAMRPPYIPGMR